MRMLKDHRVGKILVLVVCHCCPHQALLPSHAHTTIRHAHHLILGKKLLLLVLAETGLGLKSKDQLYVHKGTQIPARLAWESN